MLEHITINAHSSIRIDDGKVMYFDPFKIEKEKHDADIIFFSHDHFDHFSVEDFKKICKADTVYVMPWSLRESALKEGISEKDIFCLAPSDEISIENIRIKATHAYNEGRPFHPKGNNWIGFLVEAAGKSYFIAGDTDNIPEIGDIKCDVALLPCSGTYTMDSSQAAELANRIRPAYAIPTHYGCVAGTTKDGEAFEKLVDPSVQVVIKIA